MSPLDLTRHWLAFICLVFASLMVIEAIARNVRGSLKSSQDIFRSPRWVLLIFDVIAAAMWITALVMAWRYWGRA